MNFSEIDNYDMTNFYNNIEFRKYPLLVGKIRFFMLQYLLKAQFLYFKVPIIRSKTRNHVKDINFNLGESSLCLNYSSALYLGALSSIYNKVFTVETAFRNENDYSNHLFEFEMIEAEWMDDDFDNLLSTLEQFVKSTVEYFNTELCSVYFCDKKKCILELPIRRVTYKDILRELSINECNRTFDSIEAEISRKINQPYFVIYYPQKSSWRAKKYDSRYCYAASVILPGGYGELLECSVRETNYQIIREKFDANELVEKYDWYLKAIKLDGRCRVGFGLGIERMANWLLGQDNIHLMQFFAR